MTPRQAFEALLRAAYAGDIGGMRAAIAEGADPNARERSSQALILHRIMAPFHLPCATALHAATQGGHPVAVTYLLDAGAQFTGSEAELIRYAIHAKSRSCLAALFDRGMSWTEANSVELIDLAALGLVEETQGLRAWFDREGNVDPALLDSTAHIYRGAVWRARARIESEGWT